MIRLILSTGIRPANVRVFKKAVTAKASKFGVVAFISGTMGMMIAKDLIDC